MRRVFALILVGILGGSDTARAGYWWWGREAELLDGIRAPDDRQRPWLDRGRPLAGDREPNRGSQTSWMDIEIGAL